MTWRVLGEDRKVAIVVEQDFHGDLIAMAAMHPVWIVETPKNAPRIKEAWTRGTQMNLCYINKFQPSEPNEPNENLIGVLDGVDLHHGEETKGGGYDGIIVHGVKPDGVLEEKLKRLGFEITEVMADEFVAKGTLLEPIYLKHFSDI